MFEKLSDEQLLTMLQRQAEACERVVAMPDAERTTPGPKGQASPEQAGTMNALFAVLADQEAVRRGLKDASF